MTVCAGRRLRKCIRHAIVEGVSDAPSLGMLCNLAGLSGRVVRQCLSDLAGRTRASEFPISELRIEDASADYRVHRYSISHGF